MMHPLSDVFVTLLWKSTSFAIRDAPDTLGGTLEFVNTLGATPQEQIRVRVALHTT